MAVNVFYPVSKRYRLAIMFDFSEQMRLLIEDIGEKVDLFSHVRTQQIMVSCADARNNGEAGTWAQLYPMKYENGHYSIRERIGNKIYLYKTNKLRIGRREVLYIIYFMMPRFQNLSYFQKLETIFHELYHISPVFDGRLRKLHPRFVFHGPSVKLYDQHIRYWVRRYLDSDPDERRAAFLKFNYQALEKQYGAVDQVYIPEPREMLRVFVSRHRNKKKK